jgi:hypothetical protein
MDFSSEIKASSLKTKQYNQIKKKHNIYSLFTFRDNSKLEMRFCA